MSNQDFIELYAEICNKLQTSRTAFELIKTGKNLSEDYVDRAIEDLIKLEQLCKGFAQRCS